jgi:NosR/NirI family nitrous oxide reductase transcriptional regulator
LAIAIEALKEDGVPVRLRRGCASADSAVVLAARQVFARAAVPFFALLSLMLVCVSQAHAEAGHLRERLTPEVMAVVWPGAEKLGPEEGNPPAIAVYRDGQVAGYIFSTLDIVKATGFSLIPFDVIAGVDLAGTISGAKVIFQREPHVYEDEVKEPELDTFLARTAGLAAQGPNPDALPASFVTGATVSSSAMRDAVFDSAQLVLIARGLMKPLPTGPTQPIVDIEGFTELSWDDLIAEGSFVHKVISNKDVSAALGKAEIADGTLDVPFSDPEGTYIDLYTGLATPAAIGKNVLGNSWASYLGPRGKRMKFLGQKIFVASNGPYDFLDDAAAGNGRFDRLRVVQGDQTYTFSDKQYQRITLAGHTGIAAFDHAAIFTLPAAARFDPLKPWRLELLVNAQTETGSPASLAFPVEYKLPASLVLMPPAPAWVATWIDALPNITIVGGLLTLLTLILTFQSKLVQSRRLHRIIRNSFLVFVVVWLGWTAGAQLSILHVLKYMLAPFHGADVGLYLAEPLIVIIGLYTIISLLLIGRGVFCGWLCPFGALQELLGQVSHFLRLPQWNPPESVQKYLWLGKYVSAALVLGLGIFSTELGSRISEVEPFDTAITSHFLRAWPYVVYACALLTIGLFTERAYCRFLCPLGGVLALADRLHLLNLLKRRPECGSPCHLCERSCPVKAISRTGEIKTAECFQCLDCQVEYYDDRRCPPLVAIRRRAGKPTGGARIPAGAAIAAGKA